MVPVRKLFTRTLSAEEFLALGSLCEEIQRKKDGGVGIAASVPKTS
jgi:hypothetical protein